jgi:hypothetical protein
MKNLQQKLREDTPMRVTCYVLGALAIVVSVTVSIVAILR